MKKKVRIEIIDIAKAITIFLVMMGHSASNMDTSLFRRFLYSFHMPLFFFLAGLSIKPKVLHNKDEVFAFLKKNILALVVPYFIWGLVFGPFSFENILKLIYGSWRSIGNSGTLSSLWYLPCLFLARIYVQVVFNLCERKEQRTFLYTAIAVLFLAVDYFLPFLEAGYIWCADIAFSAAAFILLGVVLRKPLIILSQQKISVLSLILAASVVLLYFGTIYQGDALYLIRMCESDYGNYFWFLHNSLWGSATVLIASMILSLLSRESSHPFSTSLITYIGTHTMGIFLLHKNIILYLFVPMLSAYITDPLALAFVSSTIVLPIVLLLCRIIEEYIPQLLGQFPLNEYSTSSTAQ